jgi:N-acetylglutamate synthase-like GNAT family acetyltransferase
MIRRIEERDLTRVSALIQNTLLVSNSVDYDLGIIANLIAAFSPSQLRAIAKKRRIFICEENGTVLGTIGLEDNRVYNFFVAPDRQGSGVGQELLDFVENGARKEGWKKLSVASSLTAVAFYRKRGYVRKGEQDNETYGRTVTMEKRL